VLDATGQCAETCSDALNPLENFSSSNGGECADCDLSTGCSACGVNNYCS